MNDIVVVGGVEKMNDVGGAEGQRFLQQHLTRNGSVFWCDIPCDICNDRNQTHA